MVIQASNRFVQCLPSGLPKWWLAKGNSIGVLLLAKTRQNNIIYCTTCFFIALSKLVHPLDKWANRQANPTQPLYNQGYSQFIKCDEPPSNGNITSKWVHGTWLSHPFWALLDGCLMVDGAKNMILFIIDPSKSIKIHENLQFSTANEG